MALAEAALCGKRSVPMRRIPFAVLALLVVIHAAPASARGSPGMVAAANPLAAAAGMKVLKAGGSAVDAAVAIQATLGLVEPQSSGLGGGGGTHTR